jgi:hypothetical protein
MGTAVPLHQEPQLRPPRPSAAVFGRSATPLGTDPGLAEPAADRFSPDPEPLPFLQHLDEVGVVELGIDFPVEGQDPLAELGTSGVGGFSASVPMGQALWPFSAVPGQQPLGLAITDLHQSSRDLQRDAFPHNLLEDLDPL